MGPTATQAPGANELALERTDLALERTVMAAQRTVMAWARTGLSQISFGFALYKFLEAMKVEGGPIIGEVLIGLGTLAVLLGAADYFATITRLNRTYGSAFPRLRYHLVLVLVIGFVGTLLFVTIAIGRAVV